MEGRLAIPTVYVCGHTSRARSGRTGRSECRRAPLGWAGPRARAPVVEAEDLESFVASPGPPPPSWVSLSPGPGRDRGHPQLHGSRACRAHRGVEGAHPLPDSS